MKLSECAADAAAKSVWSQTERAVAANQGVPVRDKRAYTALMFLWINVLCDCYGFSHLYQVPLMTRGRWAKLSLIDPFVLSRDLATCVECLRRYGVNTQAFPGLAKLVTTDVYNVLCSLKSNLVADNTDEAVLMHRLLTCVSFPTRANLCLPSEDLVWEEYKSLDLSLPLSVPHEWTDTFRRYLSTVYAPEHLSVLASHGPGAVNDVDSAGRQPKTAAEKTHLLTITPRINYVWSRFSQGWSSYATLPLSQRKSCRFHVVPKSLCKNRSICIEPIAHQFFQQSLRRSLERMVKDSWLGRHVDFRSQHRNLSYARRGSLDGSWSTIDLSNASDSISWVLVESVFGDTPLFRLLWSVRSDTVERDGESFRLRKAFTSGSAVCFPVETIVFSFICAAVVESITGMHPSMHRHNTFMVFGDDIVIRSEFYEGVMEALSQLGFKANMSKSFCGVGFTECCGGEFYHGHNVTPFRIPRFFSIWDRMKPDNAHPWSSLRCDNVRMLRRVLFAKGNNARLTEYGSLLSQGVSFSNSCLQHGLMNTRRAVLHAFYRSESNIPLLWADNGLVGFRDDNSHLFRDEAKSAAYQQRYCYVLVVVEKLKRNPLSLEQASLDAWFIERAREQVVSQDNLYTVLARNGHRSVSGDIQLRLTSVPV